MMPEYGFSRARRSRRSTRQRPFRSRWPSWCRPFIPPRLPGADHSRSTTSSKSAWHFTTFSSERPLSGRHPWQGWQAAALVAGVDPAVPGTTAALQRVPSRRTVGQCPQQGADRSHAGRLLGARRQPGRTGYDLLSRILREGHPVRSQGSEGRADRPDHDGTSNTILVVEAKEAVTWTKPESEIPFAEVKPGEQPKPIIQDLGGHFNQGFNALFATGLSGSFARA